MLVILLKAFLATNAVVLAGFTAILFSLSFNDDIKTGLARVYALIAAVFSWLVWIMFFQV